MWDNYGNLINSLVAGADLYPNRLMVPMSQIEIVPMTRETYRASPFLDHRMVRGNGEPAMLPFSALRDRISEFGSPGVTNYIFHNAFACSTLLSRYLDALNGPLVLREPNILYELATIRRFEGQPMLVPLRDISWEMLFGFVQGMLARRYSPELPTIVKPSDGCNNLMERILSGNAGNRGVFIYSSLERFLSSVLKLQERYEWARIRVRELLMDSYRESGVLPLRPESLSSWQAATMVWVLHTETFARMVRDRGDAVCVSVDADELVRSPLKVVSGVCMHFGYGYDRKYLESCLGDTALNVHSKAGHVKYDPELREQDFMESRDRFSDDIDAALEWARPYCTEREPDAALPCALVAE
jgi:hypothetical protein